MNTTIDLPNKAYLLPESIANWPPAWWFWPILFVLLSGFIFITYLFIRRHKKRTYRREALAKLLELHELSDRALVELCLSLIKRCLKTEKNDTLLRLSNAELIPLLDKQMGRKKYSFQNLTEELIELPYQPNTQLSPDKRQALIDTTRYWIRSHRA